MGIEMEEFEHTGMEAIKHYRRGVYKVDRMELCRQMDVSPATLTRWAKDGIFPERVPELSKLTGIPRHVLRPDLWEAPE